ncbi:Rubrerythrin [Clostridium cavendishii DSM 21758]|uniref:Rubrerythrin n=1 Tax=Clostridium cavendishii DSM 21758 TaxID=1121302 RepID=A0A1M6FCU0_9CLOT|nr:ferritin family protein [Clostridium cavendishii]SHI95497.1 Rubrerythrin [Clostridium cavendishii DSM 21758]
MSYTTNRQPQGILINKETFLREGMIAEIVAINDYSRFISLTSNKEVKDLFYHIMEDEKEHYGMFLNTLRNIDNDHEKLKAEIKDHIQISEKYKHKFKEYSTVKDMKNELLMNIREAIKGELEAIVLYESFIKNLSEEDEEDIVEIIVKIIKDEKEHTEELTLALTLLDEDKYGLISCN